jgi:hypothetical protein
MTAADIARTRLDTYLQEKLHDEFDFAAWEFYTYLLEKAKSRKVSQDGYLPEAYAKDHAEAREYHGEEH